MVNSSIDKLESHVLHVEENMYQSNGSNEAYRYIYNLLNDFSQKNAQMSSANYLSTDNMAQYMIEQNKRNSQYNNYDAKRNMISASYDNISYMNDVYKARAFQVRDNINEEIYQYRHVFINHERNFISKFKRAITQI
jgi:hypothetical protein